MAEATLDQRLKIGDDLWIVFVEIATVREQDVNAQQMQPRHFDRLTENIQQRGQVESLPYCHQPNGEGVISVISGHHRLRAARAAGMSHIPVILDTREMSRSEVVAKQIAHNELSGSPDEQVLRQMLAMIDNVDDMLMTGLDESFLPTVEPDDTNLLIPHADFDWRLVTLLFLPDQLEDFKEALAGIDRKAEVIGVAAREQFDAFAKVCLDYGRQHEIKSVATVITHLTDLAKAEIDAAEGGAATVPASQIIGRMKKTSSTKIRKAVEAAQKADPSLSVEDVLVAWAESTMA